MNHPAFQDQIPGNGCYGCGPHNDNGLRLNYPKLVPIDQPLPLCATVFEASLKITRISRSLFSDGQACARGEVLAIRVPDDWRG